jgi:mannitol/fructose-specific phosphotransferase system IIA component (Ntr-type)
VAVGLTRKGIADVATEKPIESVFFILSPASRPNDMIQILAFVSKAFRDRQLMKNLRIASTADDVLSAIKNWESDQDKSKMNE